MRIVVTADDFGWSEDTVDATIACFEAGAITGASIIPNMPATDRAIAYAKEHPELAFGVHLTFAGDGIERPMPGVGPDHLAPVTDEGVYHAPRRVRIEALTRRLSRKWVEDQVRAQIEHVMAQGVPVAYVDSRKHLHKLGLFRSALAAVLPEFGIGRVRNVQTVYLKPPLKSATFYLGPVWRRGLRRAFATTDDFFMPTSLGDTEWARAAGAGIFRDARGRRPPRL